jgi:predicted permease
MIGDLRYAFRSLMADKGFALAAVATLGLGIGATTAAFSVVNAVLVRRLPVADPQALVMFYWLRLPEPMVASYSGYGRPGPNGAGLRTSFSSLTFERFRDRSSTLANVFAIARPRDTSVSADGQTEAVSGDLVSGGYFQTLGVGAARGRTLTVDDDRQGAEAVGVISYRYWQRRFQQDPAIVGKAIAVNRIPVVIVGVTAAGFDGIRIGESTDITLPMALATQLDGGTARPSSLWWVQIMARLRLGVEPARARADLERLFDDSVRESWAARPPSTTSMGTSIPRLGIMDGSRGPEGPRRDALPVLAAVFGIAVIILLIGCVNVANLVLARMFTRQQEIAIRLALGASRRRILRQLLTENLLLAMAGAVLGTVVAFWGRDFLQWLPADAPVVDPTISLPVLLFAGGLSVLTALLCGFGPAVGATRVDLTSRVKAPLRGRGIVRRALVVVQVTLSLTLLVVAGQLLQTLHNLGRIEVGFETENLLVFRVNPVERSGAAGASRAFQVLETLSTEIARIPGVRSATMSVVPLLAHSEWSAMVTADPGKPARSAYIQGVGPNFFQTMGIPRIAGRMLSDTDRDGAPRVAVINEALARQLFEEASPMGRQFEFVEGADRGVRVEVVGVVRDAAYARLQEAHPPTLYMPHRQMRPTAMTFALRTAGDPLTLAAAVRQAVGRVDPALSVTGVKTQERQIRETIALPAALATVTSAFGIVALGLACLGLYGIVSFDVARRTREIGIRMALGARRPDVIRFVLREMGAVVALGAGLGWGVAFAASTAVRGVMFGVAPGNPVAMAGATLILAVAAGVAGYLPARRATSVDPTQTLRHE